MYNYTHPCTATHLCMPMNMSKSQQPHECHITGCMERTRTCCLQFWSGGVSIGTLSVYTRCWNKRLTHASSSPCQEAAVGRRSCGKGNLGLASHLVVC